MLIKLTFLFIFAIYLVVLRKPEAGPRGDLSTSKEKWASLLQASPILLVVTVTIGGMYTGFFTPVAASSVGAFLTLAVALSMRTLICKKAG